MCLRRRWDLRGWAVMDRCEDSSVGEYQGCVYGLWFS